ncbi:MAG: hypothetical protein M1837_005468 [Sclerophora amabilis]|nr:MAG: hypothetical protein M1837_005468 [Sclerophora amabilis]
MYQSAIAALMACLLLPLQAAAQDSGGESSGSSDSGGSDTVDDAGGASGDSTGFVNLSRGATVAIIVVAVVVGVGGVASAVLFYLAKKRQWEIRRSIRRSARRLTGNFSNAKARTSNRRERGVSRLTQERPHSKSNDAKNTDMEKGNTKVQSTFEIEPPTPKPWTAKIFGFARFGR